MLNRIYTNNILKKSIYFRCRSGFVSIFFTVLILLLFSAPGCQSVSQPSGRVVLPEKTIGPVNWSASELQRNRAIRLLRKTDRAGYYLLRIKDSEKPHYHDHHDLTVVVLKGQSRINFKNRRENLKPGDLAHIPAGTLHWAENTGPGDSELFLVFTPPFDGKDRRFEGK